MSLDYPLPDPYKLTREIEAAFVERRAPFFPMGNLAGWCDALYGVLNYGELEQVTHAIRHAGGALRACQFVRNTSLSLELMPPVDERYLPFRDDWSKDVQIVPRKNAETVMLVFSGRGVPGLGMPTNMVHRWLGRLPVSLVYLRDLVDVSEFSYYLGGLLRSGKTGVPLSLSCDDSSPRSGGGESSATATRAACLLRCITASI